MNTATPGSWDSKHPAGAPYFLEYLPLLKASGGVANFDPSFSYELFIPSTGPGGPVTDPEAAYVRSLIDHAEQRGRIPVLTATRSLGRVAGLKATAPGLHMVLYRNLYQQWCSYTEQYVSGELSFIRTITTIMELGRHDPTIRDLLRLFPVVEPSETSSNTFYLFVFLHIYLYSQAVDAADYVIDVNRLSDGSRHRSDVEAIFAAQGLSVDFSDARPSTAYSLMNFPCRADMLERVQVVSDAIIARAPSERACAFTTQVVSDFLAEQERHEFYNKRLRSVLLSTQRERDDAAAANADARRDAEALRAERDRLAGERDEALRVAAEAHGAVDALRAERDAAVCDHAVIESERNVAIQDKAALESEHCRLGEDLAALSGARDRLTVERDAALAARDDAESERQRAADFYVKLAHWSMAYHDSTARSLSWRLTWPLRWLGIGRPERPPRPDLP